MRLKIAFCMCTALAAAALLFGQQIKFGIESSLRPVIAIP